MGELINLVIIRGKEKITCRVRRGMRLLQALAEAGVKLELPCGGVGTCGGCRVLLKGEVPPPTPEEERFFSGQMLAEGWRLLPNLAAGDTEPTCRGGAARYRSGFVEKRRSTHAHARGPVGQRWIWGLRL